jgi:hypothetical protein
MLKLSIWRLFNSVRDGAVVQATIDNGKSWQNVGGHLDGLNWFNSFAISGSPGGQNIGWSNIQDAGWIKSRHSLDMFKNKKDVQFRVAYGSDGTALNNNGIAFDNFWIGERNRTTLLEHFTNSSDTLSKRANEELNSFVEANELSAIDIQYHTSFPGPDPFNDDDPSFPGIRVLYYGLMDVPYTIMDGGAKSDHKFDYSEPLNENLILAESLIDSKFSIDIGSERNNDVLTVTVELSALENIPVRELSLHIAVIEREIHGITGLNGETVFSNVVKTMLPDAAGTTLYKAWLAGEKNKARFNWQLANVYDDTELKIVAFIQDESSHEVYQAAIDTIGLSLGTYIPRTVDSGINEFIVYPNPASKVSYVKFNDPVTEDLTLQMFNNIGSLVYTTRVSKGTEVIEIPVGDLSFGLYLLRIYSYDKLVGVSKLSISK